MNGPVLAADDMPRFIAHLQACIEFPIEQVQRCHDWKLLFGRIRRAYTQFQARVDAGHASWMQFEPYEIADWGAIFTPIEEAAWQDIRCMGLPLWPQLPVGRFMLDFGNPVLKVGLECDGARFHNAVRDAARDQALAQMGWRIYRAPGWQCMRDWDYPRGYEDWDDETRQAYAADQQAQTLRPILDCIKAHFQQDAA